MILTLLLRRPSQYKDVAPVENRSYGLESAYMSCLPYFKAIAAMSLNRVIGDGNKIPWYLPEDFQWFKQVTTGHVLVMGRRTFESIGKPLPGRTTIVLSRAGRS